LQEYWIYFILFFVGALTCDICYNLIYVYRIDKNLDSVFLNHVLFGFHYMGLMMSFIGLMEAYFVAIKKLGWKNNGAKVELSYFKALKRELKKIVTMFLNSFTR